MASRSFYPHEKPLAQVLTEFKEELRDFIATRIALLRSEMREKIATAGSAFVAIAVGAVTALIAGLFLAVTLVALIAMGFGGGPGAWAAAFAIMGVFLLLGGGLLLAFGVRQLKERGLKPERTLRTLKEDQIWLQNETRGIR